MSALGVIRNHRLSSWLVILLVVVPAGFVTVSVEPEPGERA